MSIEKVRTYLKQFNADNRIIEFATSSATVELAAQAAGCDPARIAKPFPLSCMMTALSSSSQQAIQGR